MIIGKKIANKKTTANGNRLIEYDKETLNVSPRALEMTTSTTTNSIALIKNATKP